LEANARDSERRTCTEYTRQLQLGQYDEPFVQAHGAPYAVDLLHRDATVAVAVPQQVNTLCQP